MITRVKKRSTMFVKFSSYRFFVSAYSQVSDCWRKSIDSGNDSFTLFWKQLEHNNSFSYYCLLFVNFWTTRTKPLFYNTFMPLWRCCYECFNVIWPSFGVTWLCIQSASVLSLLGCSSECSTELQCLSFWCHEIKVLVINKCLKIGLCHCRMCACLHTVSVMRITQHQCNNKCTPGHCVGKGVVKMSWSGFIPLSFGWTLGWKYRIERLFWRSHRFLSVSVGL